MKYTVLWTATAQKDLKNIYDYICEHDSDGRAAEIFERIRKKAVSLESFPLRGRELPELAYHNILGYREFVDHPWRIVYKVTSDKVFILSVFDGRRSFDTILMSRILQG